MKNLLQKDWVHYLIYVAVALIGIWFLTKLWIPEGYAVAGHDSGLAINAADFLKTRFYAWDDRIGFGTDNSPHFGSIVLHGIDHLLSSLGQTQFAGNQLAVFFWLSMLFVFSGIFSYSIKSKLGNYFSYLFPVFMTFNFFIFQSVFILERAKYELVCVTLLYLTFSLKMFFDKNYPVLKSAVIFSLVATIFNGGSWFGLPLYGGMLVAGFSLIVFAFVYSIKDKNFGYFGRIVFFNFVSIFLFILLNIYSILPFVSTLAGSDYAKVVSAGTIASGREWLDYLSRGTFFINLFRFQGVPEWYLTGGFPNPDYNYATFYLTDPLFILISYLLPIVALAGLIKVKEKTEKYLLGFFAVLLLVSMFFTSGTNSPIGFVYNFLYEKIPGFSIFRSPYYKFASLFTLSFSVLLAYSLSKFITAVVNQTKLLKFRKLSAILKTFFVLGIAGGWLAYNFIVFNSTALFQWQEGKSTLQKVPDYVYQFDAWLKSSKFDGRALMVPGMDASGADGYQWGYWSLSTLPSSIFINGSYVSNDSANTPIEGDWVNSLYLTLLKNDGSFVSFAKRLGINYIFLRTDVLNVDKQNDYVQSVKNLANQGSIKLIKSIGAWSMYKIESGDDPVLFTLGANISTVPDDHSFLSKELQSTKYGENFWVNSESVDANLKRMTSEQFFPQVCDSCSMENLNKQAEFPSVWMLPNSPFYQFRKRSMERAISSSADGNTKLAVYLSLVMTKLSEVRSMRDMHIESVYIAQGLRDMNDYLKNSNDIVSGSDTLKSNYYFVTRVYETTNSIQKYLRDYVGDSSFGSEKSYLKDEVLKALWLSGVLKKEYDGLLGDTKKWSQEKLYNINLPADGVYGMLINTGSLPVDNSGKTIYPTEIITGGGVSFSEKQFKLDSYGWLGVDNVVLSKNDKLKVLFPDLPNLFKILSYGVVDFPTGSRGCLTATINHFNKFEKYNISVSSLDPAVQLRFIIKENTVVKSKDDFLKGDIEDDIFLGAGEGSYKFNYVPAANADEPRIYICSNGPSEPTGILVNAREIFNPRLYVVKTNGVNPSTGKIDYQRVTPTKYRISVSDISSDRIVVFNSTFNGQWTLKDTSGKIITNHFVVDGYKNGWLLPEDKDQQLELDYLPQGRFETGLKISLSTLIILGVLCIVITIKRNKK